MNGFPGQTTSTASRNSNNNNNMNGNGIKTNVNQFHQQMMSSSDSDDKSSSDRKMFLGGLSWDTTEDDIRDYFSSFGSVESVSIKFDALTFNPRGFGFITFVESSSVESVLSSGPHKIKDKVIDPKRAKSRPTCKKIFVGGIDSSTSEEEIRGYFSRFGIIEGVELPFDRVKGKRREFVFVIFDSEEAASRAAEHPKQRIGNREVDVKKATPQPVAQAMKRSQSSSYDPYYGGAGGGQAYYPGYGSGHPGHGYPSARGAGSSFPQRSYPPRRSYPPPSYDPSYYSSDPYYSSSPSPHHHPDYYGSSTGYSYPPPHPSTHHHHYPPPSASYEASSSEGGYYDESSAYSYPTVDQHAYPAAPPSSSGGKMIGSRVRPQHPHPYAASSGVGHPPPPPVTSVPLPRH